MTEYGDACAEEKHLGGPESQDSRPLGWRVGSDRGNWGKRSNSRILCPGLVLIPQVGSYGRVTEVRKGGNEGERLYSTKQSGIPGK